MTTIYAMLAAALGVGFAWLIRRIKRRWLAWLTGIVAGVSLAYLLTVFGIVLTAQTYREAGIRPTSMAGPATGAAWYFICGIGAFWIFVALAARRERPVKSRVSAPKRRASWIAKARLGGAALRVLHDEYDYEPNSRQAQTLKSIVATVVERGGDARDVACFFMCVQLNILTPGADSRAFAKKQIGNLRRSWARSNPPSWDSYALISEVAERHGLKEELRPSTERAS